MKEDNFQETILKRYSMTEVENRLIVINSIDGIQRNSTYLSDMLFNFQNILTDEDDIISSNICVMNAQFPVSFYTINELNNVFGVSTNINLFQTFTIPVGNYNANTLITKLNSLVTAGLISVVFSFSSLNGKVTLTGGVGVTSITFSSALSQFYKVIGSVFPISTGTNVLNMPYPLNLLGVKKIIIKSQLLGISSFESGTNQSITLSTIPNNNSPFTMISYENRSNLNKLIVRARKIDAIDIQLLDEDNNKLNFNNVQWTLTLVLENIRKINRPEIPNFMQLLQQQNELVPLNEDNTGV